MSEHSSSSINTETRKTSVREPVNKKDGASTSRAAKLKSIPIALCGDICNQKCTLFFSLFGFVVGGILGVTLKYWPLIDQENFWRGRNLSYVKLPGEIFVNMFRSLSIPIFLSSVVAAIGSMDVKMFRFTAWRIFAYIFTTTVIASVLGALFACAFNPGHPSDHPLHPVCFDRIKVNSTHFTTWCTEDGHPCDPRQYDKELWNKQDRLKGLTIPQGPQFVYCSDKFIVANCILSPDSLMSLFRSFVPFNLIQSFVSKVLVVPNLAFPQSSSVTLKYDDCFTYTISKAAEKPRLEDFHLKFIKIAGANPNGLITFFTFLSLACISMSSSAEPFINFITSLSTCLLQMFDWFSWLSPIGITSLIAGQILDGENNFRFPPTLIYYILTCVSALLLHTFVVMPLMYICILRESPLRFYMQLVPVMINSFGTSLSAGSAPLAMMFLEKKCQLDPRIVRFVIPVSSQVNKDGFTLVTVVAVLYLAQLHGIQTDFEMCFRAVAMTFVACTSTAPSVQGGMFFRRMVIALSGVGLPKEFIVYISPVQWIITAFATVTNVLTDCVGCAIINHLCFSRLDESTKMGATIDVVEERKLFSSEQNLFKSAMGSRNTNTQTGEAPAGEDTESDADFISNGRKDAATETENTMSVAML